MLTHTPLRSAIAGLCLVAGMASAQAALTMRFEEDTAKGQFTIFFSGEQATPFLEMTTAGPDQGIGLLANSSAYVLEGGGYYTALDWFVGEGSLPVESSYAFAISHSGTGGIFLAGFPEIMSTSPSGNLVSWDGTGTYLGSLESIGLADGQSGSISITKGSDSITVYWSAAVMPIPEPATYALVLGLGIAGIALVRRRRASR